MLGRVVGGEILHSIDIKREGLFKRNHIDIYFSLQSEDPMPMPR
jgi:hypothetical protein